MAGPGGGLNWQRAARSTCRCHIVARRKGGGRGLCGGVPAFPLHAVWGAEYTTALDAITSICGCDVSQWPHAVYRPRAALYPERTLSTAEFLGEVVQSPHFDVAWLESRRYC